VAQPLIVASQIQCWRQLQTFLPKPIALAGYSLGEFTACAGLNLFPANQEVILAGHRAQCMDTAAPFDCGLLAVLGLSESVLLEALAESQVEIAIRNGPRHFVLGGLRKNLQTAQTLAEAKGATRCVRLNVATPSHTSLLTPATTEFRNKLEACVDRAQWPRQASLPLPLICGQNGRVLSTVEQALNSLANELSQTLDWESCLETVKEMNPDVVLEIGPGNALCRLWNELYPEVRARSTSDFRSVAGLESWLQGL